MRGTSTWLAAGLGLTTFGFVLLAGHWLGARQGLTLVLAIAFGAEAAQAVLFAPAITRSLVGYRPLVFGIPAVLLGTAGVALAASSAEAWARRAAVLAFVAAAIQAALAAAELRARRRTGPASR